MSESFKLLIDCSSLVMGGGIQAGLSVLSFAVEEPGVLVHLACSSEFWAEVPEPTRARLASSLVGNARGSWARLRFGRRVSKYERGIAPAVAFTVFGPAYWTSTSPRLQGFALPRLIYPEVRIPQSRYPWHTAIQWVESRAKTAFLQYRKSDWFVVETDTVKERLKKHAKIPDARIFVIGNTFSPLFQPHARTSQSSKHVESYNILVPASYYPHKNLEFVPKVAKSLENKISSDFVFTFCVPENSTGWSRIHRMARSLHVESRIRSVGQVPHSEFNGLYSSADVVFLPTLLECSSAVYPESFASARPLITSDADFSRELCGNAALYCSSTDEDDAANRILEVLTDGRTRERLVKRGFERLAQNYLTPEQKWRRQMRLLRDLAACS